MVKLSDAVCEFLGYEIPIYFGAIYDEAEGREIYFANAQVAFHPPTGPFKPLHVRRISLTANNKQHLLHEIMHVVIKVDLNMWQYKTAIPLCYEEYLCEYHSHLLCGRSPKEAEKIATKYIRYSGHDPFAIFYEKRHDIITTRILIEYSDLYRTIRNICLP